jgi:hypothetical protein
MQSSQLIVAQRTGKRPTRKQAGLYKPVLQTLTALRTAPRGSAQRRTAAKVLRFYQAKKTRSAALMAARVSRATAAAAAPRPVAG